MSIYFKNQRFYLTLLSVSLFFSVFLSIASPNEDDEDSSEEDEEDDFSYAVLHSAIHNLTTRINNISANTTLLNPATYLASITPNVTHSITIEDDDFDYGYIHTYFNLKYKYCLS